MKDEKDIYEEFGKVVFDNYKYKPCEPELEEKVFFVVAILLSIALTITIFILTR